MKVRGEPRVYPFGLVVERDVERIRFILVRPRAVRHHGGQVDRPILVRNDSVVGASGLWIVKETLQGGG